MLGDRSGSPLTGSRRDHAAGSARRRGGYVVRKVLIAIEGPILDARIPFSEVRGNRTRSEERG
jgi:hypothetical protein